MNKATLKRLKNNPHYKLSARQREEIEEDGEIIHFGKPPIEKNIVETTHTNFKRKGV